MNSFFNLLIFFVIVFFNEIVLIWKFLWKLFNLVMYKVILSFWFRCFNFFLNFGIKCLFFIFSIISCIIEIGVFI